MGGSALETGVLAQIDGLAAVLRPARAFSAPAELDDEAARTIAGALQPVLARGSAPISGRAHAALLRLLARG